MKSMRKTSAPYHHGNLRKALLEIAVELIRERGADALTIRGVARRAGVSHTAPYRHFRNKASLLAAVACEGFEMMVKQTRERFSEIPNDTLARLRVCGIAYIDFAIQNPARYRVMFGPGRPHRKDSALRKASEESFGLLMECIKECQKDGTVKPGEPMEMALAAWSIVHGFSMLFIDNQIREKGMFEADRKAMMNMVVGNLYTGLHKI
jgi:AcrR family transcriptional regulator